MEDGIYPLNTCRFLLESDPVAVSGHTRSPDEEFTDVEEHVSFELTFPDGPVAACTSSYRAHPDSHLRITGTEGSLQLESAFFSGDRRVLTVERADRRLETTGRPLDEVVEEFDYFAHCLRTGSHPLPDGEHGLTDLDVINAIYDSARKDERVHL
jgi:xylose dehydrogenase (NAD/NADP)